MSWRSAVASFLQRLEIYELATILMSGALFAIFITNIERFHEAFGLTTTSHLLWGNIESIYQNALSWVFTFVLLLCIGVFIWTKNTTSMLLLKSRSMIRILTSFCSMMAIYKIMIFYIRVYNPVDRDVTLQHIDSLLFGGKLLSEWIAPLSSPIFTALFFTVYMSWFATTYITLFIMWRHSQQAVREYAAATLIAFYIGYIAYAIVPAVGPIFTVHYSNTLGSITQLLTGDGSYLPRDCFPSLHTGISIVMLFFIRRYRKDLFKAYLIITTLIIVSTQYLRVHYGIDVIAGAALGLSVSIFTPYWIHKWAHARLTLQGTNSTTDINMPVTHTAESISELA